MLNHLKLTVNRMNRKLALIALFFILSTVLSINFARADNNGINITTVPSEIMEKFGVSLFVAQIIASTFLIVIVSALVGFAVRGSNQLPIIAICDFLAMGICVALQWLPIWTFTVCIFLVALLTGLRLKDLI